MSPSETDVRARYKRCELRIMELSDGRPAYGVFESSSKYARMLSMGWWYKELEAWASVTL